MNRGRYDILLDNYSKSVELFKSHGIDLDHLCSNTVGILSGKPNHYKLLFKIDKPLQTKKIVAPVSELLELLIKSSHIFLIESGSGCRLLKSPRHS
jgi:CRISPR/Cas system-associated protein Cas7 (RAMP superfamily)